MRYEDLNQHVVYAVTEWGGPRKLRVSEPMSYDDALKVWQTLHVMHSDEGTTAARQPVQYYAVRSADDPHWPSERPCCIVRFADDSFPALEGPAQYQAWRTEWNQLCRELDLAHLQIGVNE